MNWEKIKAEVTKFADVEYLRKELHKISQDIGRFNLKSYLAPSTQKKIKSLEDRYNNMLRVYPEDTKKLRQRV